MLSSQVAPYVNRIFKQAKDVQLDPTSIGTLEDTYEKTLKVITKSGYTFNAGLQVRTTPTIILAYRKYSRELNLVIKKAGIVVVDNRNGSYQTNSFDPELLPVILEEL